MSVDNANKYDHFFGILRTTKSIVRARQAYRARELKGGRRQKKVRQVLDDYEMEKLKLERKRQQKEYDAKMELEKQASEERRAQHAKVFEEMDHIKAKFEGRDLSLFDLGPYHCSVFGVTPPVRVEDEADSDEDEIEEMGTPGKPKRDNRKDKLTEEEKAKAAYEDGFSRARPLRRYSELSHAPGKYEKMIGKKGRRGQKLACEIDRSYSSLPLRMQENTIVAAEKPGDKAIGKRVDQGKPVEEYQIQDIIQPYLPDAVIEHKKAFDDAMARQAAQIVGLAGRAQVLDEIHKLVQQLQTNSRGIKQVRFVGSELKDSEAKSLSTGLKKNAHVRQLLLPNNRIGDEGAAHLATALLTNRALMLLNLSANEVADGGAQAIAEALRSNTTLTSLTIGARQKVEKWQRSLRQARRADRKPPNDRRRLLMNTVLTDRRRVGAAGVAALAGGLAKNTRLVELRLPCGHAGDAGALALSAAIAVNCCLTTLSLEANGVCDEGARALARGLARNFASGGKLQSLDLSRNEIFDDGAVLLAQSMRRTKAKFLSGFAGMGSGMGVAGGNRTLLELDLSFNGLGPRGLNAVAAALRDRVPVQRPPPLMEQEPGYQSGQAKLGKLQQGRGAPEAQRKIKSVAEVVKDGSLLEVLMNEHGSRPVKGEAEDEDASRNEDAPRLRLKPSAVFLKDQARHGMEPVNGSHVFGNTGLHLTLHGAAQRAADADKAAAAARAAL